MIGLPPVSELYRRYAVFARKFFDNEVPPVDQVTIEWSKKMTSAAGLCRPSRKLIRLSTHYHLKHPEDIDQTLLHEMIHLLVPNHGPLFYRWMEKIRKRGGTVHRHSKERATPIRYRWRYTCKGCGSRRLNVRRYPKGGIHYRCGRCGSGLLEEQLIATKKAGNES